MIRIESGQKGEHTRADAVSALADARILVRRAAQAAPWRRKEARAARKKLDEADRSIQAGHFGSAIFFTSRARRIAETLQHESETAAGQTGVLFISASRVNVRAGPSTGYEVLDTLVRRTPVLVESNQGLWVQVRTPSGTVGWIHNSLLQDG